MSALRVYSVGVVFGGSRLTMTAVVCEETENACGGL